MKKTDILRLSALLLFIGLCLHALVHYQPSFGMDDIDDGSYGDAGEALLHGVRSPGVSFRMPMASILHALVFNHLGVSWRHWMQFMGGIDSVLSLALSCLLLPLGSFLAAAAFVLLRAGHAFPLSDNPETPYSRLVLLAAGLLVWRAQRPTYRRSMIFSLSMGASLLYRSPLAFFPPVLALFEWNGRSRGYWKHALILCVTPYLFLIPWMRLNSNAYHHLIPFEYQAADSNMATGALGMTQTVEGSWQELIDEPLDTESPHAVFKWALREIFRHPARYGTAFVRRLRFVFLLHPILWLWGSAGLWLARDKAEYRRLGLLIFYFVAVHCSMSVVRRYFEPLWPVLAIVAASALMRLRSPEPHEPHPLCGLALTSCLGLALILSLYVEWRVNSYASAAYSSAREEALDKGLLSYPEDAWLLAERGRSRLDAGDFSGAVSDISKSAALQPWTQGNIPLLLRARMLGGDAKPLLEWPLLPESSYGNRQIDLRALVFKAEALLRAGRKEEALQNLRAARSVNDSLAVVKDPVAPDDKRKLLARLTSDRAFLCQLRAFLGARAAELERLARTP